jgi:uncharacterized protein (AIM24 family)
MAQIPQDFVPDRSFQVLGGSFAPQQPLMFYQIGGRPAFSYGDIYIQPNQKILTDGKAMLWMDGSLMIETECYGGCGAACARSCSGESCCMNNFSGVGKLTVGFENPGDMLAFAVTPSHPWCLTKAAFVAGTANLKVSCKFAGCLTCCCTDEGPFLTTVEIDPESQTQSGIFLAGSYGMLERHDVPEGKELYVAKGNFFAGHASKDLDVGLVGGCMNLCFGAGWKSVVLVFKGPCTVYTQSRNPEDLRRMQEYARNKRAAQEGGQNQGQGSAQASGP